METLYFLTSYNKGEGELAVACTFVFIPPEKTYSGYSLIGRNYDFPSPYGEIAKNLTITILHHFDNVSVAIVGLPGQNILP